MREIALLTEVRVLVALGAFGWDAALRALAALGHEVRPRPRFGHGAEAVVGPYTLLGTYHPSQQNTFTGRLTAPMFEAVIARAKAIVRSELASPATDDGVEPFEDDAIERDRRLDEAFEHRHPVAAADAFGVDRDHHQAARGVLVGVASSSVQISRTADGADRPGRPGPGSKCGQSSSAQ